MINRKSIPITNVGKEKLDYLVPVFQKVASNDEANIIAETVYLNTCQTFTYLSINNINYYSNYNSSFAPMIVEIIPSGNYLYKLVYAEPLNTTGALRYITLYLSSGDIVEVTLVSSSSPIKGSVSSGKANLIELTIKP
ncbi:MAG: hypothetical protein K5751_10230 [Treponemataceae bacterium]|nr:hypothetical protein [Treponemataceae bacterium]